MTRTSKSLRNIFVALSCQLLMTVAGFAARKVFLLVLDTEYLGLSGLFSSVLTMLSLAELGIGPAMIFSLYKPLADNDIQVCRSLMRLYKKVYLIIGTVILSAGILISPFISVFLKEVPGQIGHISFIFVLFVIDTAISYFFSYKRSLIIADQSYYQIDIAHTATYILRNGMQIAVLFLTGSYYLFLVIQILSTVCENLWLSKWADKYFGWLKDCAKAEPLPREIRTPIVRNVKAMVFHRVGGVVSDAIDNVVISYFFGVAFLGLYSNYLLVIDAVKKFVTAIFSAISASIGDFGTTEGEESSYILYRRIEFLNFWIAVFCSTCIYVLLPPFIGLFFGEQYKIDQRIFIMVSVNFYIEFMRKTILTFKESYGLPWYDRYKPIVGAVVNIITSVAFSFKFGIIGVFIGTTITQLCVNVWVEAKVVFNHAFGKSVLVFLEEYMVYAGICFAVITLTKGINGMLWGFSDSVNFIIGCFICVLLPNIIVVILFNHTEEMRYVKSMIKGLLRKQLRKK